MTDDKIRRAQPRVDVIILSWDRIPDTIEAIDSALAQQGVRVTVCVVDQGSSPDARATLVEACRTRDNVTLQCNDCNTGVAEGRNQASRLGRAPYIVALDNDAVFADQHQIARAVEIARADADLYALAFRIVRFDDGADDATSWSYPERMQECAALPFLTSRFVGAGHLLRRDAFEACGEYDPRLFFLHEELDLSYRLINAGGLIRYTPEVVVRHKVSAERRVWNHQRHVFHIRNSVYLMTKYRFSRFSGVLPAVRTVAGSLRKGQAHATVQGAVAALPMVTHALRFRLTDPRVQMTSRTQALLRQFEAGQLYPHRRVVSDTAS